VQAVLCHFELQPRDRQLEFFLVVNFLGLGDRSACFPCLSFGVFLLLQSQVKEFIWYD
jgi:hypothetical protein